MAQISVLTQHYDIARTGANTGETILTPANVSSTQFGKLFSYPVDGYVYAQPLYVPAVTMGAGTPQAGTKHNVVFVATENDSVYAFDADSNSPVANASPLWRITLLDAAHGAARGARVMLSSDINNQTDIIPVIGITSTPVIDPATGTLYVVGKTKENNTYVQRLHALSITNGAEKFGGPVKLQASVPGNGTGSVSGTLHFDPYWQNQRPGLLLLHGIVYIGFGAHEDFGAWHGWILAYNAATLRQTGVWCSTPNGADGGIWGAGTGLAADVPDPTGHPYGRIFIATGNGSFSAVAPNYNNSMNYGDSVIKLDLANGVPTMTAAGKAVGDVFTPFDQARLNNQDIDQGSGGTLLLPNTASGTQRLLVQAGKTGRIYVVNQDSMGGYHPTNTVDPQQKTSVPTVYSALLIGTAMFTSGLPATTSAPTPSSMASCLRQPHPLPAPFPISRVPHPSSPQMETRTESSGISSAKTSPAKATPLSMLTTPATSPGSSIQAIRIYLETIRAQP